MKAARIIQTSQPLEIQQLETPKPKASQVLVKVQAAGVCHSDLHLWEGAYEGLQGQVIKTTDRGIRYPLTPGHEIAGVIESIGEDVKEFAKGDRVLIYPWIGDGLCPACRAGEENVCDNPRSLGIYFDGGYAEYVLVPNYRYLIRLDDNIDINAGAILGCSVLTAYGAVRNAMLKPNDNVIVVGAGGIGLMAIQSVKAVTEARIIAMDIDDKKLQAAKSNGADVIINSKTQDPVKSVMELTDNLGADAVLDIVNASKTVETDMKLLRKRGKVVLVGLFGGELRLNLVTMPTRAYKLMGSYTGTMADLIELVSLAERGIIKPIVSDRFKLEQATEALEKLKAGQVIGRGVINP
jgi:propanol-preferring alcohol dehydrogenase